MEELVNVYQKIIYKICDKTITKEDLEKLISKELKTYNPKRVKQLGYKDICELVYELTEENSNKKKD